MCSTNNVVDSKKNAIGVLKCKKGYPLQIHFIKELKVAYYRYFYLFVCLFHKNPAQKKIKSKDIWETFSRGTYFLNDWKKLFKISNVSFHL